MKKSFAGGDALRKVSGIKSLMMYLDSMQTVLTEQEINKLMEKKEIPHFKPVNNTVIFDLDHIDWWLEKKKVNSME